MEEIPWCAAIVVSSCFFSAWGSRGAAVRRVVVVVHRRWSTPQMSERKKVQRVDIGVGGNWMNMLWSREARESVKFWELVDDESADSVRGGRESANSICGRWEREFCSWAAKARNLFVGAPKYNGTRFGAPSLDQDRVWAATRMNDP
jgi:hypothetical protein